MFIIRDAFTNSVDTNYGAFSNLPSLAENIGYFSLIISIAIQFVISFFTFILTRRPTHPLSDRHNSHSVKHNLTHSARSIRFH